MMNRDSLPSWPPIDCPQVLLQPRSIMASKCLSTHPRSQPQSASLSSLNRSLPVYNQTCSITVSKFKQTWSPGASPNSLDHSLEVSMIIPSKAISKVTNSWPPRASPNWLDHGLQVHLSVPTISASKCVSGITRLSYSGPPQIPLKHRLQRAQIYPV